MIGRRILWREGEDSGHIVFAIRKQTEIDVCPPFPLFHSVSPQAYGTVLFTFMVELPTSVYLSETPSQTHPEVFSKGILNPTKMVIEIKHRRHPLWGPISPAALAITADDLL